VPMLNGSGDTGHGIQELLCLSGRSYVHFFVPLFYRLDVLCSDTIPQIWEYLISFSFYSDFLQMLFLDSLSIAKREATDPEN
jgi:hypothetical protein